jgi:hypothetical protein
LPHELDFRVISNLRSEQTREISVRFPARTRKIPSSSKFQTFPRAYTVSYPFVKRPECEANHSPPLVSRLITRGAVRFHNVVLLRNGTT